MSAEVVRLVPFTDDELKDIQLTSFDKMMEINRNLKANSLLNGNKAAARTEIERLSKVVEKCSTYCSN